MFIEMLKEEDAGVSISTIKIQLTDTDLVSKRMGMERIHHKQFKGEDEAWVLGISRFVELKGKSDRGEAIALLTFGEMTKRFLLKEHRRINSIPHEGITKTRYRLLESQVRWLREFINDDEKPVHRLRKNTFLTYDVWRNERAKEVGKSPPRATTINQELSTLRRCFQEVAVANGFLTRDSTPEIPNIKLIKKIKNTGEMTLPIKSGR